MTHVKDFIESSNGIAFGDVPGVNMLQHTLTGSPEEFTNERLAVVIFKYALAGYEVIHYEWIDYPNGDVGLELTLAWDYVYFSYS